MCRVFLTPHPFPKQALVLTCLHYKYLENAGFPQCFLPTLRNFLHLSSNLSLSQTSPCFYVSAILVSRNTQFFHSAFYQCEELSSIFIKFIPFPNKPWFLRVCSISIQKKLLQKEKLLVASNFSLFHNAFYPLEELSSIFIKFKVVVCKFIQSGRV